MPKSKSLETNDFVLACDLMIEAAILHNEFANKISKMEQSPLRFYHSIALKIVD